MIIPSEDKVRALVNRAVRALEKEPGIRLLDEDAVRRALRKGIEAELSVLEAIDETAREKIRSLSRRVAEGTREWDELFARYVSEERRRRGI